MAGNRKQPFGYRMEFGEYTPHPAEAETVRWIYQTYLAGASYQELVEALQERGIAYVTNAEAGHGLLRVGGAIVPFANEFPRTGALYQLWNTTPTDK